MRNLRMTALCVTAALAAGAPASAAVIIDTFSAGGFNLSSTAAGSNSVVVSCGLTCLGGTRDVLVAHNSGPIEAFVQLSSPPTEAQSVIPDGGGQLRFAYTAPGAAGVDLTSGGVGVNLIVFFTAFEPGADARVTIEDTTGASATSGQSPSGPSIAIYPLSDFAGVNLAQARSVKLLITSPDVGDYHVGDIRVPDPSPASTKLIVLNPVQPTTSGFAGGYPSDPPIRIAAERGLVRFMDLTLALTDVGGFDAGGSAVQVPASIVAAQPPDPCQPPEPCDPVFLTTTLLAHPPDPHNVIQRFEFTEPGNPMSLLTQKVRHDWTPGRTSFSAEADVGKAGNDPGTYGHMIFVEVPPSQPGIITDVTAAPGSMNLSIQMSGVDANQPLLWTNMGGSFTPAPAIPAAGPAGLIVLGALILLLGVGLVILRRRESPRSA